jgi:hypothetical protein
VSDLLEQAPLALHETNGHAVRLNLGAGPTSVPGFENVDRQTGQEVYPLDVPDGSVDEILASHVLEHFGHQEVFTVLQHWVEKLSPGGKIRIAVPDFERVAREYLDGQPINVQGYVMGGHVDDNDWHGAIFDRESLAEMMIAAGLERIGPWASDVPGCSQLPISLNLQGFKPSGPERTLQNVRACMSVPRYGPLMHPRCVEKAFYQLKIRLDSRQSCYWHQQLSILMEEAIADPSCEFVLTMDFDTVFCAADVLELYRLLKACPEADAIFPLQAKRGCETALFTMTDRNGRLRDSINAADLYRNLLPANTGHFGLTMFRADSLRNFPRPWMVPEPNFAGRWDNGQIDADIDFWRRFKAAGLRCYLAPRVVVGHLEEIIKWPGVDLKPVYQTTADYGEAGIPADVVR